MSRFFEYKSSPCNSCRVASRLQRGTVTPPLSASALLLLSTTTYLHGGFEAREVSIYSLARSAGSRSHVLRLDVQAVARSRGGQAQHRQGDNDFATRHQVLK